jgi:hypothetical protein
MGRHVIRGLLSASRPEGWEFIEKMLLAAQREEGLRQSILETVDEAHPDAFRRMLRCIRENNLGRFSAVVRAADVWLGLQWDSISVKVINEALESIESYLQDPVAREEALNGKNAEKAYFALWSIAFDNAPKALAPARKLLKHSKPEFRYAATHLLTELALPEAHEILLDVLDDAAPQVLATAMSRLQALGVEDNGVRDVFERVEKRLPDLPPKASALKPLIWPWESFKYSKAAALDCMAANIGDRSPTRLIPYLGGMSPDIRAFTAQKLATQEKWDAATRDTLFSLLGDASSHVRQSALKGLEKCKIEPAEAEQLEKLLTRNAGDLRRGILGLLLSMDDSSALKSAERLLAAASSQERVAGLELLRMMVGAKRFVDKARASATAFSERAKISEAEQTQIDAILGEETSTLTLENGLGLFDPALRTIPPQPQTRKVRLHSPTSMKIIKSLAELIRKNQELKIRLVGWNDSVSEQLLGEVRWGFPEPKASLPLKDDLERWPAKDLWIEWFNERPKDLKDEDGFELVRTVALLESELGAGYRQKKALIKKHAALLEQIFGMATWRELDFETMIKDILLWLIRWNPPAGLNDFLLDSAETVFSMVPEDARSEKPGARKLVEAEGVYAYMDPYEHWNWRQEFGFATWFELIGTLWEYHPQAWTQEHLKRHWQLAKWRDEPTRGLELKDRVTLPRLRPELSLTARAFKAGYANETDVLDEIIGPRERELGRDWDTLAGFSDLKPPLWIQSCEFLRPYFERARDRVLDVEVKRGDNPTIVTNAAISLRSVPGVERLGQILKALGTRNFARGYASGEDKESTLSHLARRCFPKTGEGAAVFKAMVAREGITETRLVELAVYAPQWAAFVEATLGWNGLEEGVWWIHAHTKGMDWTVEQEIREKWSAEMSRRTPLSSEDLQEGGVDVEWFKKVHEALGSKRWDALYDAAKFAAKGVGHTRAKIFADAMLGQLNRKELIARVQTKRQQDSLRALGLLPLAKGAAREKDILERFKVIQEFVRTSKQFGSQRQASEKRAAAIGQENLARTAGYRDPIRLQWSMEAKAIADFAKGPKKLNVEGVDIALGIDSFGAIELTVARDGKTLSDVPAKLKKHPKIVALKEERTELRRQAARVRPTLEALMCRGDTFTAEELQELCKHPLIAPMIGNLVLIGDDVMGYPTDGGRTLQDEAGKKEALKKAEVLRIAHPVDFWPAAKWHRWQKDCLARERIQPFKQVFREFYPPTKAELDAKDESKRYAGHQVQPRQALSLLGGRGWLTSSEAGVNKTFHEQGVTVSLEFQEGFYTPAEVEGLTLEAVHFATRKDAKTLPIKDVPPRLFSEVMRDLDLVVSVAHRGGVDPEASASTIEMRTALVRETCALLKIKNVRLKENRALIDGKLGTYSVHLGSAQVHRLPGGALGLVAVGAQHRGRLFLPFADDDPKTAEALSKILMLARDSEIKDPNILDQLRS